MPLQNRVTPYGDIVATSARGTLMGNRGGQLHRADRTLTGRRWVSKAWIACVLEYKGRRETTMAPGHYTQLFFLDEATALAAGHRPCALCRRDDYERFRHAWQQAEGLDRAPSAPWMDARLHADRLEAPRGGKRTYTASVAELAPGVMLDLEGRPYLLLDDCLHPWSAQGYGEPRPAGGGKVAILTPASIVATLRYGYTPGIHASCRGGGT